MSRATVMIVPWHKNHLVMRIAGAFAVLLLTSGCASWQWHEEASAAVPDSEKPILDDTKSEASADERMVDSLVQVLAQVFEPFDTTVQVTEASDEASVQMVVDQLIRVGFGIQRVPADQGAHYLRVVRDTTPRQGLDKSVRYEIGIGRTRVSRVFERKSPHDVQPVSAVTLLGSRAPVELNDSVFGSSIDGSISRVAYGALVPTDDSSPIISLITPELVDRIARQSVSASAPSLQALNADRVQVGNLYYQNQSNFGSFLDTHERVDRRIIVFANDSMVLGPANKEQVVELASRFLEGFDVINLVGCSNGPTELAIGNEGLALGRAKRVADELSSFGIPRKRIVDEGCWAPVSTAGKFPGRGVIMELWRETL